MSSRPQKKRALAEEVTSPSLNLSFSGFANHSKHRDSESGTSTGAPTVWSLALERHVETLQAELEHERAMRELDRVRAEQVKQTLEKQITIAFQDANHSKEMLDEYKSEFNRVTEQLRLSRDEAMKEVRRLQIELTESAHFDDDEEAYAVDEDGDGERGRDNTAVRLWREKYHRLQAQVEAQQAHENELQQQLQELREDIESRIKEPTSHSLSPAEIQPLVEDAPPALLKELNKVRIALAETQRRQRQQERALEDAQRRNKLLIQEREAFKLNASRLPAVENRLQQLYREHETAQASNLNWQEFARSLASELEGYGDVLTRDDVPPHATKILRIVKVIRKEKDELYLRVKNLERESSSLQQEKQAFSNLTEEICQSQLLNKELEAKLEGLQRQLQAQEHQQRLYKREIDSLHSLLSTFDKLPLVPKIERTADSPGAAPSLAQMSLEVSLATAREELLLADKERERLKNEVEAKTVVEKELRNEIEMVRRKYEKLRDALEAERAKVHRAEERAAEAETLAGKGSFNPDKTRVLHFGDTPLLKALREEIDVLRRQLEVSKKDKTSKLTPDPEKLNQRLKENFKEQIALFREGVYLMTGFKVDMLPSTDRPTFRVRSVYAEREEDYLMFKWPTTEEVASLDILKTDFAEMLASSSSSSSYQYMTKFHSLPAFLASVQLGLFEKQTVVV